ncbi:NAD-dependent deacetylase [Paenibacillus turicensis]|uniref:NAD-dependent protein deacetylase n=1 Tax=Paenibacillus turicensis TaxID=160487 RepID=A0ABS4FQZ9_9BACL|nr:NAD-dependent protein deacylase [Paenibacillus turicensis]MBP1904829.1 NAD-dependent deacetylase [Paenibacillus turicensis]
MNQEQILADWIKDSKKIVFFGGAGISTESGIPDFRSAAGLYQAQHQSPYSPEEILSRRFFNRHPEIFFDFYKSKMLHLDAQPNAAHQFLARLEQNDQLEAIITQNIDGLHTDAGNKKVWELHGSIHRNFCMGCGRFYSLDEVANSNEVVPRCGDCGKIVKPDVVLYEENLNENVISGAIEAMQQGDLLLIGGTSLTVYPAANFIHYFRGGRIVLLNSSSTPYDDQVDMHIKEPIGAVLERVGKIISL